MSENINIQKSVKITRKRINSSEPPYSNKTIEDQNLLKKDFSNSQQVKKLKDQKNEEIINKFLNEDNQSSQQSEYKLNSSVISEYVLMDSNMLKTPQKMFDDFSSELQDSDEIKNQEDFLIKDIKKIKRRESANPFFKHTTKLKKQSSENMNSDINKENIQQNIQYDDIVQSKQFQQNLPDDIQSNKTTSEINALKNIRQKQVSKPIYFNVLVTGESGLGKSTFIDLFLSKRFTKQQVIRPKTKQFTENRGERNDGNISFHINMVDTPGYTHGTDLKQWYDDIRSYIVEKFEIHNQVEEINIENHNNNQETIETNDMKLHVCLYFLQGHRIKDTDMAIIKKLQKYINIIPILAKGDSYTYEEVKEVKKQLLIDAKKYGITWFDIKKSLKNTPDYQQKLENGPHGIAPPFLMISSIKKIEIKPNYWVFGRMYRWGTCNIEDPEHSDFNLLYSVLIGHLSMDLIEHTKFKCQQYFRQKKYELKQKRKKQNQEKYAFLRGAIVTVGLAITTLLVYPVKSTTAKTLNL